MCNVVILAAFLVPLIIVGAVVGGVVGSRKARASSSAPSPSPTGNSTSGCSTKSNWNFNKGGHANVTMGSRSFLVHVPSSYSSGSRVAHPLVLSYHGYSMNETTQEKITSFSEEGIQVNGTDIVAVYPAGAWGPGKPGDGPTRAWQGAPYSAAGVDDVGVFQFTQWTT